MGKVLAQQATSFGGSWTIKKLDILEEYLNAYTTALKNKPFRLTYIDAFAGSGRVTLGNPNREAEDLISGSAERAIRIGDKPFDRLVFVDKDLESCRELERLRLAYPARSIQIERADANRFLQRIDVNWGTWRGVLFLDPFATQVEWSTVKRIAGFNALDTWLLFPEFAIQRMLPRSRKPEDVSAGWARRLDPIYGDDSWRGLYRESQQQSLFDEPHYERDPGADGLLGIYKNNLKNRFGDRLLDRSITLRAPIGSPLFEFLFCVGNKSGIGLAKRIADHISKGF